MWVPPPRFATSHFPHQNYRLRREVTPSCTPPCGPPGLGPAGARSPPGVRVSRLGGSGEGLLGTEEPGVPLSPSQAHTGPRHPSGASKDTSSDSCPDGRSACASELGSAKLLHTTLAPGRRPHGPSTCTHTRSPAPESAKILEKRARRVGGRGGVLTPPSCPLPPRPQPDPDAPAYLHARQARLHRGVGHGARRRHFLARDARSRAASRPGAARSPRVAGRALEPEATAPRGRSQRRLAGRGPIH